MQLKIPAPDFDVGKTLNSGQVFHWQADDGGFYGLIDDVPLFVRQRDEMLLVEAGAPAPRGGHRSRLQHASSQEPAPPLAEVIRHYFALDHPLNDICSSFPKDTTMTAAADYCRGLRIIRQAQWECLATFICSSMKQVAHIRQISHALRQCFGQQRRIKGRTLYTFPTAARVANASEHDLRKCGLGYRAKNLLRTARLVASGRANLEQWSHSADAQLREQLCELPGVGPKVANCVMLFAYERLRAFPIDVWIQRVLREQYFSGKRKPTAAKLRAFTAQYFGEHGGYAQQYLFHHARTAGQSERARRVLPTKHTKNTK